MKGFTCAIFVIILLQVSTIESYSQDTLREEQSFNNSITLDLGRFLWNEARIGYERRTMEKIWWRFTIGFQYPTSESFENYSQNYGYGYEPFYNRVSTGIYVGTGISAFIKEGFGKYISLEAYYNFAFYDHKYYIYTSAHTPDDRETFESMRQSKIGVKILYGKKFRDLSIGNADFEVDIFTGVGLQYRLRYITEEEYLDQDGILRPFNPPQKKTHENLYPTLHIGFLIGIPFGLR